MNNRFKNRGLVHIYTGDGKGKTTSAIGLSIRAKSRGLNIMFVQFLKEKDPENEIALLSRIGIRTIVFEKIKSPLFNPEIDRLYLQNETREALAYLRDTLAKSQFDLIILDEFICLVSEGLLPEDEAIDFIKCKHSRLEMVLTGTGATDGLIKNADYVTLMKSVKHPFRENLQARKGIEF